VLLLALNDDQDRPEPSSHLWSLIEDSKAHIEMASNRRWLLYAPYLPSAADEQNMQELVRCQRVWLGHDTIQRIIHEYEHGLGLKALERDCGELNAESRLDKPVIGTEGNALIESCKLLYSRFRNHKLV
jgi:hypothetical protein